MKEREPKFQIIIDGKIKKTIKGWDSLDKSQNDWVNTLKKDGKYQELYKSSSGSDGYLIYFCEDLLKSNVFAWREITPFVDKNGEKIYYGDLIQRGDVVYELNECSEFLGKETPSGYYIRINCGRGWNDYPITAKEIKEEYVVVRNVFPKIQKK